MTIYIHYGAGRQAEKVLNVGVIKDNGPMSIMVKGQFSDTFKTYSDVSHVAIQPNRKDDYE